MRLPAGSKRSRVGHLRRDLRGDQDLVRHGQIGKPRRQVHDRAIVVAAAKQEVPAGQRAARRDVGVVDEPFEQRQRRIAGRARVDGDEHHLVTDQLDQTTVARRDDIVRRFLEAIDDRGELRVDIRSDRVVNPTRSTKPIVRCSVSTDSAAAPSLTADRRRHVSPEQALQGHLHASSERTPRRFSCASTSSLARGQQRSLGGREYRATAASAI